VIDYAWQHTVPINILVWTASVMAGAVAGLVTGLLFGRADRRELLTALECGRPTSACAVCGRLLAPAPCPKCTTIVIDIAAEQTLRERCRIDAKETVRIE
jgi:hypothetical protein